MKIQYCSDYQEMSQLCSDSLISDLRENDERLICVATGNSPEGVYKNLVKGYVLEPQIYKGLSLVKLDEWGGIPMTELSSCESFIKKKILHPLSITADRYISFNSNPSNPEQECKRVQEELDKKGPIDICILGLGKNGHLGFNEPAKALNPYCHVAKLSKDSLEHQMTEYMKAKPSYGLTLGMADILQSRKIILLIAGSGKEKAISEFLSKKITPHLPASFLWLHPNVECYIDMDEVSGI